MALIKCSECGKEISDTSKSCIHCGNPIDKKIVCEECKKEVNKNIKICPNCGNTIKENKTKVFSGIFKKHNISKKYCIIGLVVLVIIILLIIVINSMKNNKIDLKKVYDEIGCDSYYCEIASDGSYFSIDTNPLDIDDYTSSLAMEYVEKANISLEFTEALYSKMGKTRAMDGTLSDSNDRINVSWTYHPDDGFEVLYSKKN